jgi:SAM-dependent methyltransferase
VSPSFERHAADWLAWARTPNHDAYWQYRHAFFALLPEPIPSARALEVGCGEGRVTRDLRERGHDVTAIDASPTLVRAAQAADPGGSYAVAAAEDLPFGDATFDLVATYNVLMDLDDVAPAVAEMGRVLRPGGCLCVCVTHPFTDATRVGERGMTVDWDYLAGGELEPVVDERNGLRMTWEGARFPLHAYAGALEAAGLAIEALREPQPAPDAPPRYDPYRRLPMFLMFRARRAGEAPPAGGASGA